MSANFRSSLEFPHEKSSWVNNEATMILSRPLLFTASGIGR